MLDTWKHLDIIAKKIMRFVAVREFLEFFPTESWQPRKIHQCPLGLYLLDFIQ